MRTLQLACLLIMSGIGGCDPCGRGEIANIWQTVPPYAAIEIPESEHTGVLRYRTPPIATLADAIVEEFRLDGQRVLVGGPKGVDKLFPLNGRRVTIKGKLTSNGFFLIAGSATCAKQ